MGERLDIAVVGSGVSGLTAAHVLGRRHRVTLYERDERLGGHANTIAVPGEGGREVALDTGFIVHNERTYPTLLRLFADLGVTTQESDMSFSVRCEGCGLEYAGARGLQGVMPRASVLGRPRYLRMLAEVKLFHRHARGLIRVQRAAKGRHRAELVAAGEAGDHAVDLPARHRQSDRPFAVERMSEREDAIAEHFGAGSRCDQIDIANAERRDENRSRLDLRGCICLRRTA